MERVAEIERDLAIARAEPDLQRRRLAALAHKRAGLERSLGDHQMQLTGRDGSSPSTTTRWSGACTGPASRAPVMRSGGCRGDRAGPAEPGAHRRPGEAGDRVL